jgi:hypothetical protein
MLRMSAFAGVGKLVASALRIVLSYLARQNNQLLQMRWALVPQRGVLVRFLERNHGHCFFGPNVP